MKLSAHQLNYLPHPQLLSKINYSDSFVYLMNIQFEKKSWQSRNFINSNRNKLMLSVPIKNKDTIQLIKDIKIDNDTKWSIKHFKSILTNYSKSNYFKQYIDFFDEIYLKKKWIYLADFNEKVLLYLIKELNITTRILSDEEFSFKEKKTNYLIELCRNFEATTYISNKGSQDYVDLGLFKKNNINHFFINYKNYVYDNKNKEILNNLSIFDMLFNCGPKASEDIVKDISNLEVSENHSLLK